MSSYKNVHKIYCGKLSSSKSLDGAPKMVAVSFVYFFLLLKTTPMLDLNQMLALMSFGG
jgi:hypothetical protein